MNYLRTSHEIKNRLETLFSGSGEKWAIVGFVGYKALDHLPSNVENLSVICWPKAGATNPDGIRRLIDKGISVYFCDRLHQKIYWKHGQGLIVGSANLSENGLGKYGLHEFAVYCNDDDFDITQVISKLDHHRVTSESLAKLDIEHTVQMRQSKDLPDEQPIAINSFLESLKTKHPKRWKIATWSEIRDDNNDIQKEIEEHYGEKIWDNDNDVESGDFESGEFVLQIKTTSEGMIQRANARWLVVDHVVERGQTKAIVQLKKLNGNISPPFAIDSIFQKNLKQAFNAIEQWHEIHDDNHSVQPTLIDAIKAMYSQS
jgi:hypothetical protein